MSETSRYPSRVGCGDFSRTSPTQRFTAQPGPLISPAMLEIFTMRAPCPGALRRAGRKVWMSRILPR